MIIDEISELPIKKKIAIFLCFPCILHEYEKSGVFSKTTVVFLVLVYFIFLVQNIVYDIYDVFNSKNSTFILYPFINIFTYLLVETIRSQTKAMLEIYLALCSLLLIVNVHWLSDLIMHTMLDEDFNYEFNQGLEVILILTSLFFLLFVIKLLHVQTDKANY